MRAFILMILLAQIYGFAQAQQDTFIEVRVDNDRPFVNEPIIYTVRAFTTGSTEGFIFREPDFTGFGRSSEITPALSTSETRNGVRYNVASQQITLFPLRAGNVTLDPYTITLPESPFAAGLAVTSDPITITIRPLPPNAPQAFQNAIGQFDVSASMDVTTIRAGEALKLALSVTGSGNIERLQSPPLNFPAAWRIFEQPPSLERNGALFGTRTFSWSIVPDDVGENTIPSIEFVFFNPQSNSYVTRRTAPIPFTVQEAGAQQQTPDTIVIPLDVIPELRSIEPPLSARAPFPTPEFWLLWLIAPFVTVIIQIITLLMRRASRANKPEVKPSKISVNRVVNQIEKIAIDNPLATYEQLHDLLLMEVSKHVGKHVTDETVRESTNHLPSKLHKALLNTIEESASGRYAPITPEDATRLRQRVQKLIKALERLP